MATTVKKILRVFKHGATEYPDPTPSGKPDDALAALAISNPSFNNAALDGPFFKGGKEVYEIKVEEGTKG